jgi:putative ABC transport system substrate-binding protein
MRADGVSKSLTHSGEGFAEKWLELLREAAPNVSHVAALWNSTNPASATLVRDLRAAARALHVRLDALDAGSRAKLDAALAAIGASGVRGLIVTADPSFYTNRAKLVQFAANKRMPAIYYAKNFVEAGGLISYGISLADLWRRAASYVDRIIKGAKPADLPVEQPTKFEMVINGRTAKALGLTIPSSLLLRADQVIE